MFEKKNFFATRRRTTIFANGLFIADSSKRRATRTSTIKRVHYIQYFGDKIHSLATQRSVESSFDESFVCVFILSSNTFINVLPNGVKSLLCFIRRVWERLRNNHTRIILGWLKRFFGHLFRVLRPASHGSIGSFLSVERFE